MEIPSLKFGDLTVPVPIVQGGMGVGISLSKLAAAVANEGGVGIISIAMIGMGEADVTKNPMEANNRALRAEIRKAKEMTDGIIGINAMVALTAYADSARIAIEEGVEIIFSGAGLPLDLPKYLLEARERDGKDYKTKLVPIVSSARAANVLTKKWRSRFGYTPDGFVLEGPKAGGHLGYSIEELTDPNFALESTLPPLIELAKQLEEEVGYTIPVIAAGGIYTGDDIAKIIKMGAHGVQIGTRFIATEECDADQRFKDAIIAAKEEDVTIIKSPVGMPGRALDGVFIDSVREGKRKPIRCPFKCLHTCDPETTPYCISAALIAAMRGNIKNGFVFCGSNAGRVDKMMTVKELIDSLKAELLLSLNPA